MASATATGASGSPAGQAVGGVPGGGPGLGHADPQVGQPVLERLERADRPGELPPLLHVGRPSSPGTARPGRAARRRASPAPAGQRRARPPRSAASPAATRLAGAVQRDVAQLPVMSSETTGACRRRRRLTLHRVQPVRHAVRGDQQHVGRQRVGYPGTVPAEPVMPAGSPALRARRPAPSPRRPAPGAAANGTASAAVTVPAASAGQQLGRHRRTAAPRSPRPRCRGTAPARPPGPLPRRRPPPPGSVAPAPPWDSAISSPAQPTSAASACHSPVS